MLADLLAIVDERRRLVEPPGRPYLIGITGSVAVGKSRLAADLAHAVEGLGGMPTASIIEADSFLLPNSIIDEQGLTTRKGFPETYDVDALRQTLAVLREGRGVEVPVYSHLVYDVMPGTTREVPPRDILIIDGLHLAAFARDLIDVVVHIDAAEEDIELWYVERFRQLYRDALADPTSYYAAFTSMGEEAAVDLAGQVWRQINLVNLREHLEPQRTEADIIVLKASDHSIVAVTRQSGAWLRGR
ncbi:MAG TPA: hypothetical protein VJM33_14900 [Microthrixaceae bacterium]|nr:hypothetical protein [Microthrixaceae bacterium]